MEIAFIVILTLGVVTIIPWMIKKDFEKRMLAALKREIVYNIERLREYDLEEQARSRTTQGPDQTQTDTRPLILKDAVFRRVQQVDFRSKGLSGEDKDLLEKVLATASQMGLPPSGGDDRRHCAENIRILEDVLIRLTAYIKGERLR
jgi:hypothetical protein